MQSLSAIIITKNEAINIADCIATAKLVADDIIVIDSGSTDGTVEIARNERVTVIEIEWNGYGHARNSAIAFAKNSWIIAIDADERITNQLAQNIKKL